MNWIERPSDAGDSWAADELRQKLLPIPVCLRVEAGRIDGELDDVVDDVLLFGTLRILSAEVYAYAIPEAPLDRTDELRG